MSVDLMAAVKQVPLPVEDLNGLALSKFLVISNNTCPLKEMLRLHTFEECWKFLSKYKKEDFLKVDWTRYLMPLNIIVSTLKHSDVKSCWKAFNLSKQDFLEPRYFPLFWLCWRNKYSELKDFLNEMKFVKDDFLKSAPYQEFPLSFLLSENKYSELKDFLNEMKFVKDDFLKSAPNGNIPLSSLLSKNKCSELKDFLKEMKFEKKDFLKPGEGGNFSLIELCHHHKYSELKDFLNEMKFEKKDFLKPGKGGTFSLIELCHHHKNSELKDFLNEMKFEKKDFLKPGKGGTFSLIELCHHHKYSELKDFLMKMKFGKEDYLQLREDGDFPLNWLCLHNNYSELKDFLNEMKFVKEDYLKPTVSVGNFPLYWLCCWNRYSELKVFFEEMKFSKEDYLKTKRNGRSPLYELCKKDNYSDLKDFLNNMEFSKEYYLNLGKTPLRYLVTSVKSPIEFAHLFGHIFNISGKYLFLEQSDALIQSHFKELLSHIPYKLLFDPLGKNLPSLFEQFSDSYKSILLYESLGDEKASEFLTPHIRKVPEHILMNRVITGGNFVLNKMSGLLPFSSLSQFLKERWSIHQKTFSGDTPLINICRRNKYSEIQKSILGCHESDLVHKNSDGMSALTELFKNNKYQDMNTLFEHISPDIIPNSPILLQILCSHNTSTQFIKYLCSSDFKQSHFCESNYIPLRSLCKNVKYSVLAPLLDKLDFKDIANDLLDVPKVLYYLAKNSDSFPKSLTSADAFPQPILFTKVDEGKSPFYWIGRRMSHLFASFHTITVPDSLPKSLVDENSWLFWIARLEWISIIDMKWTDNLKKEDILGDTLIYLGKSGHFEFSRLVEKFGIGLIELENLDSETLLWCSKNNFRCVSSFEIPPKSLFKSCDTGETPFAYLCLNQNPFLNNLFDEAEELKISTSDVMEKKGHICPIDELLRFREFKHMSRVLSLCEVTRVDLLKSHRLAHLCKFHSKCIPQLKEILNPEDFSNCKDAGGHSALYWLFNAEYHTDLPKMLPSSIEYELLGYICTDSTLLDHFLKSEATRMYLREISSISNSQKFQLCINHGCLNEAVHYWKLLSPEEIVQPDPWKSALSVAEKHEQMNALVEVAKGKLSIDILRLYTQRQVLLNLELTDVPAHGIDGSCYGKSGDNTFVVLDVQNSVQFLNDLKIMKESSLFCTFQPISRSSTRLIFQDFDFTLREYLSSKDSLTREESRCILSWILKSLAAIHSKHLQILKLTPDNIIFKKSNQDWDVSFIISSNYKEYQSPKDPLEDIWSLGIIYSEMLSGKPEKNAEMKDLVLDSMLCPPESRKTALGLLNLLENDPIVELKMGNKEKIVPELHPVEYKLLSWDSYSIGPRKKNSSFFSGRIRERHNWIQVDIKKADSDLELDISMSVDHANARCLRGAYKEYGIIYLAYEPMEHLGDISDTTRRIPMKSEIIKTLVLLTKDLHDKGIVHGMISPKSLYLKEGSVFVGDFSSSFISLPNIRVKNTRTDKYRALEEFLSKETDLWSLGRVIAEIEGILLSDPPTNGSDEEIYSHISLARRKISKSKSKFRKLIKALLDDNPEDRSLLHAMF